MMPRKHSALLLSLVLILGTIVSPIVHYSWMASSGHFDVAVGHRVDVDMPVQTSEQNGASGSSVHTMDFDIHSGKVLVGMEHVDEAHVTALHLVCDYGSLMGTLSAVPVAPHEVPGPSTWCQTDASISDQIGDGKISESIHPRGPPLV